MPTPYQIPDEAVEAALHAYDMSFKNDYTTGEQDIAAAIAAALSAWPGVSEIIIGINRGSLILPIPQDDPE